MPSYVHIEWCTPRTKTAMRWKGMIDSLFFALAPSSAYEAAPHYGSYLAHARLNLRMLRTWWHGRPTHRSAALVVAPLTVYIRKGRVSLYVVVSDRTITPAIIIGQSA